MELAAARRTADRAKRLPLIRTAVAVQQRYGRDEANVLASALTYHGFLSLFPLLLLGLSVLGFAMSADPEMRGELGRRMTAAVPGIGALVGSALSSVQDHRAGAGVVGLAGLAWSGAGIVATAQLALARVFGFEAPSGLAASIKRLGTLAVLGAVAVASAVAGGVAGGLHGHGVTGVALHAAGAAATLAVDVGLFLASYRVLSAGHGPALGALVPGAMLAGAGWTVLKVAGSWYATRTVSNAQAVYGTFAVTVGVLVVISLGARLFLYGAELIAVRDERGGVDGETSTHRPDAGRASAA